MFWIWLVCGVEVWEDVVVGLWFVFVFKLGDCVGYLGDDVVVCFCDGGLWVYNVCVGEFVVVVGGCVYCCWGGWFDRGGWWGGCEVVFDGWGYGWGVSSVCEFGGCCGYGGVKGVGFVVEVWYGDWFVVV